MYEYHLKKFNYTKMYMTQINDLTVEVFSLSNNVKFYAI